MRKILTILLLVLIFTLTGCDNESETIDMDGRTDAYDDDSTIVLRKGWFVRDYSIDYENRHVIINIEKDNTKE